MEELIKLALKKIELLEKKVEKYYNLLKINNELDFILRGTYLLEDEMSALIEGKELEVKNE